MASDEIDGIYTKYCFRPRSFGKNLCKFDFSCYILWSIRIITTRNRRVEQMESLGIQEGALREGDCKKYGVK